MEIVKRCTQKRKPWRPTEHTTDWHKD